MIYTLLCERHGRDHVDQHVADLVDSDRAVPAKRSQEEWERWGEDPDDLADAAAMMREFAGSR